MTTSDRHGGKRPGAGRPVGTGKYKAQTKAIRVPCDILPQINRLIAERFQQVVKFDKFSNNKSRYCQLIPLFGEKVAAGTATPTGNYIEDHVDLSEVLVRNPDTTFLVRAQGDSMVNAGIFHNDLLIVDSAVKPVHGQVVIAVINGDLTVKRLHLENNTVSLLPENPAYHAIKITEAMSFSVSGVVMNVVHHLG